MSYPITTKPQLDGRGLRPELVGSIVLRSEVSGNDFAATTSFRQLSREQTTMPAGADNSGLLVQKAHDRGIEAETMRFPVASIGDASNKMPAAIGSAEDALAKVSHSLGGMPSLSHH